MFPSEAGALFDPSNLRNLSLKRIKARAGVRKDLRFHDVRHNCLTTLLGEGVNEFRSPRQWSFEASETKLFDSGCSNRVQKDFGDLSHKVHIRLTYGE